MARSITILLASLVLAACEAPGPRMGEATDAQVRLGKITRIETVTLDDDHQLGLGAIIGGVAGGVLGHQIGSGSGNAVATVAGALGGAFLGDKVEQRRAQKSQAQHVLVRLRNDVTVGITQEPNPGLRVGDEVRIVGSGPGARVVRP